MVRPGDGATVEAILRRMDALDALGQGRVFVGRARALRGDQPLSPGDELLVFAARPASDEPSILDDRDGVIALFKPAPLPTVADHRGSHSLVRWAEEALGASLHTTSRLDVGVSGVVLVARTAEARERLASAREQGLYHRRYLALAASAPEPPEGTWGWPIGRARDPRLRAVGGRDAVAAETRFCLLARSPAGPALLQFEPLTGRTHQLRLHASHAGLPLLGDTAYGGPARLTAPSGAVVRLDRIALHAFRVQVPDAAGALWSVTAPVPDALRQVWQRLGGSDEAWPSEAASG